MSDPISRRGFMKEGLLVSAAAAALSLEEQILLAQGGPAAQEPPKKKPAPPIDPLPQGQIGKLKLSRLILGGNLIGGWAHARDLIYVSDLLKHYFTDDKIIQTMALAEDHGINTINTHPNATAVIKRYWKEGGKIQWMAQGFPDETDHFDSLRKLVDAGAHSIYIQGNVGDQLVKAGKFDLIEKAINFIRDNGLPAGIAGHELAVPVECEKKGIPVDYYVKTLHTSDYFSSRRPNQTAEVISNREDNFWCTHPDQTVAFMARVAKPWIAYKVLAAGAISPSEGFDYAFNNGADLLLVGMFDFQISQDCRAARDVLRACKRKRPWRA